MTTSPRIPRYRRVADALTRAIDAGRFQPGDRLPDERGLALQKHVSRATIRQALKLLGEAGRIERVQGSGTYVARRAAPVARYVQLVAVGYSSRCSPYLANVIGETERSAARCGLRLGVRYLDDAADLPEALRTLEGDATVAGGVLVGYVAEADVRAAATLQTPWVMLGDYTDPVRQAPVIDQVCGDDYVSAQRATACLLDQGVRRPALLTYDADGVWTRDRVSAFRSVCDAAGIPAADQEIHALVEEGRQQIGSSGEFQHAVQDGLRALVRRWTAARRFPDGITLSGRDLAYWLDLVRTTPGAEPLQRACLVAADFDLQRSRQPLPPGAPPIWWAVLDMSRITDQVLQRLLEPPAGRRPPVRDYIREVLVVRQGVWAPGNTAAGGACQNADPPVCHRPRSGNALPR